MRKGELSQYISLLSVPIFKNVDFYTVITLKMKNYQLVVILFDGTFIQVYHISFNSKFNVKFNSGLKLPLQWHLCYVKVSLTAVFQAFLL